MQPSVAQTPINFKEDDLYFIPLGGSGEIGMNANLYRYKNRCILVDLGVNFSSQTGFDIVVPDLSLLKDKNYPLDGIVITHGHEDHLGAIVPLYHKYNFTCPIYAPPFTAALIKLKAQEARVNIPLEIIPLKENFHVGPFALQYVALTHSIPEATALIISEKPWNPTTYQPQAFTLLHTGDWKDDPEPMIGEAIDFQFLSALSKEDNLSVICDSTNVFEKGRSGSEAQVAACLKQVMETLKTQRIVVACFASNVARMYSIFEAVAHINATQNQKRKIVLAGRSLKRYYALGIEFGFLPKSVQVVEEEEAANLPREEVCIIATGSQGEPRAALTRIIHKQHPFITLEEGDTLVYSSRIIPGNDIAIYALQNKAVRQGLQIITDKDYPDIHVSGHPHREELKKLYQLVKPKKVVPVHGEDRHLVEHARFARGISFEEGHVIDALPPHNGDVVCLTQSALSLEGQVPYGRHFLENTRLVEEKGRIVEEREKLFQGGSAFVTLVVEEDTIIEQKISLIGLYEPSKKREALRSMKHILLQAWKNIPSRSSDQKVDQVLEGKLRRHIFHGLKKNTFVRVHIVYLDSVDEA